MSCKQTASATKHSGILFVFRPLADPDIAALKILVIANGLEPYMDSPLMVKLINGPFLSELKGTVAEYEAGLNRAIEKGWLVIHESGTHVKFTQTGADLFA